MTTSIFGTLIPSSAVERAVLALIGVWGETYLAEIERQQALTVPTLARPRSLQSSYDFQNWTELQLPAVVCVCPGTTGTIERSGDGYYTAWFEMRLGSVVEDTTEANARRVAQLYQAALDALLVQRGSLGGFANSTVLQSRQTELPDVANRTLAYAESIFHVLVENIATSQGGPRTPDTPLPNGVPWPPWQSVLSADVEFDAERIFDELLPEGSLLPGADVLP